MDEELVDLLTLGTYTDAQWSSMVGRLGKLSRAQQANVWSQVVDRVAERPPPIRGDVSQDQWTQLCLNRYRETYMGALAESSGTMQVMGAPRATESTDLKARVEALEKLVAGGTDKGASERLERLNNDVREKDVVIATLRVKLEQAEHKYNEFYDISNEELDELKAAAIENENKLQAEIARIKEALETKIEENDILQDASNSQLGEIADLKAQLRHLQQALQAEKDELQAARAEIESLRAQMAQEVGGTRDELQRATEEARQVHEELQQARVQEQTQASELEAMRAEIERLRNELNTSEATAAQQSNDIRRLTGEYELSNTEKLRLQGELQQKSITFRQTVERMAQEIQALHQEAEAKEEELRRLNEQLSAQRAGSNTLSGLLGNNQQTLEELKTTVDQLRQQLETMETNKAMLESSLVTEQQRLQQLITDSVQLQVTSKSKKIELEVQIEALQRKIDKDRATLESMNVQCRDLQRLVGSMEQEINVLLNETEDINSKVQKQLKAKDLIIEALTTEQSYFSTKLSPHYQAIIETAEQQRRNLEADVESKRKIIEALQREIDGVKQDNAQATAVIETQREHNRRMETQVENLTRAEDLARQAVTRQEIETDIQKKAKEEAQKANNELQTTIQELRDELQRAQNSDIVNENARLKQELADQQQKVNAAQAEKETIADAARKAVAEAKLANDKRDEILHDSTALRHWMGMTLMPEQEELWSKSWTINQQLQARQTIKDSLSASEKSWFLRESHQTYMGVLIPTTNSSDTPRTSISIIIDCLTQLSTVCLQNQKASNANMPYQAVFGKPFDRSLVGNTNWFFLVKPKPEDPQRLWINKRIVDVCVMHALNSIRSSYQADADIIEFAIHTANCIPAQLLLEILAKIVLAPQNMDDLATKLPVEIIGNRTYYCGLFYGIFNLTYNARKELQPQPGFFATSQHTAGRFTSSSDSAPSNPPLAPAGVLTAFNPNDFFLNFNLS